MSRTNLAAAWPDEPRPVRARSLAHGRAERRRAELDVDERVDATRRRRRAAARATAAATLRRASRGDGRARAVRRVLEAQRAVQREQRVRRIAVAARARRLGRAEPSLVEPSDDVSFKDWIP